jgi:hypothetical protein
MYIFIYTCIYLYGRNIYIDVKNWMIIFLLGVI